MAWKLATMLTASSVNIAAWARRGRMPNVWALSRLNVSARNGR